MPAFTGSLHANLIFASIYNMIISQQVFADNIQKNQTLVDKARVDGGLYGDTKLFYSTDVLKTRAWGGDSEAANLLAVNRPKAPECQEITMSVYRQIDVTVDAFLTKQAWMDEGAFSNFNGVILSWLQETRRVYDGTLYNAFIGTTVSATGKQSRTVDVTTAVGSATGEEANRLEAQAIAADLADLIVEMGDYSRDFNDYQQMRSYDESSLMVIWNASYVNKLRYVDLPTIFHKEGLDAALKLSQEYLPSRYFGTVLTSSNIATYSASTPAAGKPINSSTGAYTPGSNNANGTVRTLYEVEVTVSGTKYNLFPGDEIPSGATVKASGDFELGTVYIERSDVLYKVVTVLPPYMSAFEVGTSFFNARALNENHYLTFGHNPLEYLKGKPFITAFKA